MREASHEHYSCWYAGHRTAETGQVHVLPLSRDFLTPSRHSPAGGGQGAVGEDVATDAALAEVQQASAVGAVVLCTTSPSRFVLGSTTHWREAGEVASGTAPGAVHDCRLSNTAA